MIKVSWFLKSFSAAAAAAAATVSGKTKRSTMYCICITEFGISSLEFSFVPGMLFKAQFLVARFTAAILTSGQVSQTMER